MSLNVGAVTQPGIFSHTRTINSWVHKSLTSRLTREKGRPNPSRDKNQGKHRRRKVERSSVTPGWCVHKSDVQDKWDDNTHATHGDNE